MVGQHIPTWTMMDIQKAREYAASLEGSGSTTPLLDKYKIPHSYRSKGVVYIEVAELEFVAFMETGEPLDLCSDFYGDGNGPHPRQAEIILKNHLKKHLQRPKS